MDEFLFFMGKYKIYGVFYVIFNLVFFFFKEFLVGLSFFYLITYLVIELLFNFFF